MNNIAIVVVFVIGTNLSELTKNTFGIEILISFVLIFSIEKYLLNLVGFIFKKLFGIFLSLYVDKILQSITDLLKKKFEKSKKINKKRLSKKNRKVLTKKKKLRTVQLLFWLSRMNCSI